MTPHNGHLPVGSVKVGRRFRRDLGDVRALAASIERVGLLHPVVVDPRGRLIAGRRRLAACRLLGWTSVPVRVVDPEDLVRAEHDENAVRLDFTPSEAVAIAEALEERERQAGKARRLAGLRRGQAAPVPPSWRNGDRGETRERLAAYVGMGRTSLAKARAVVEAARLDPRRFGALLEHMDRTRSVDAVYRRLRVLQEAQRLARRRPRWPSGRFSVIVADPPWPYRKLANGSPQYPALTVEAIKALPVLRLAADDAVLWLWTTNAHLPVAFDVLAAWGFEYKTTLTWVKNRPGLGEWLRGQTEHALFAVRGRPVVTLTSQNTALIGKVREHSTKPQEFYALVESLCPGPRVELFARRRRPGWTPHGAISDAMATAGHQRT